ncbi:MAG: thiamine pyrophosphate-binding protein, partial [Chloroflexi bacterium]|nr:thiamine pyrophosphate-binding protein [Chloroflexota bacterium]
MREHGVRHVFGYPGGQLTPLYDALYREPAIRHVLARDEQAAAFMADGYARATGKPALVQIHSTPGLGNAIGALYQAYRGHSPLVVIGGDAGIRQQALDAQMAGDLVAMARPVTKWATMVTDPASLLRVVRRAVKIAATPPTGPVYICLPLEILDAPVVEEVRPTVIPSTRVVPDEALLRSAATLLAPAATPMLYVGDGVAFSEAQEELARVAELLGAEVWGVDMGEVNLAWTHPLFMGMTGHMFGSASLPITRKGDVNLVVGTYLMPEVFPELGDIFAAGARTVHIDLNAYEIAKNHPVDLGLVSDPKPTLARLAALLESTMTPQQKSGAKSRGAAIASAKENRLADERTKDRAVRDAVPLHFARVMEELAGRLPRDAVIFDEALTNSPPVTRYFPATRPRSYFLTRGGSLGVGVPGAIGAKLANPTKTVVGIAGDGGSMYTIQALWTAAR